MQYLSHVSGPSTLSSLWRRCWTLLLLLALLLSGASVLRAAPTTAGQAALLVQHWLAQDATPLHTAMHQTVATVTTYTGAGSTPLYYAVALRAGGFVLVSADDQIEPIIAFAPSGSYDPSPQKTLGALVSRDLPQRMAQVPALAAVAVPAAHTAHQKWQTLLAASGQLLATAGKVGMVSDPRVDPLVKTLWSQSTIGAPAQACYNYYTPGGAIDFYGDYIPYGAGCSANDVCGCVATAAAQLMRYWQYPTAGVGTRSFPVTITDGNSDYAYPSLNLLGGDGSGGPYHWTDMPFDPEASHATLAQCQAIGALCADAGVAVNAIYSPGSTGAYMTSLSSALSSTFQFPNVMLAGTAAGSEVPIGALYQMVNPNLDAGYPVIFGIEGDNEGHCIVCDGYGYVGATMYHHLNLGWAGECNSWYNLPSINCPAAGIDFTVLDSCLYNVNISGSGEVISGRVLDSANNPVGGTTVTAVGGGNSYTTTTSARGIYAFTQMPSATTFTLSVNQVGVLAQTLVVSTGTSVAETTASDSLACGNVWGADFGTPQLTLKTTCRSLLAAPGETVTYSLTCTNHDGEAATNLQLTDMLPAQLNYVAGSASAGGSYAVSMLSWSLGALPAGQSRTVTFRATVAAWALAGSQVTDAASASYTESTIPVSSNSTGLLIASGERSNWWMFHADARHLGLSANQGPASANLAWAANLYDYVCSSAAIGADGTIYVGSYDHNLYALTAAGTPKWAFPTECTIDASPAIGTDGTIYVGSDDGNLYAVNPDGTPQWVFPTGDMVYSSPAIGADGTIYVGSFDGNLYAVNPDGSQQWAFATDSYILASPAIGADGTIYIGSDDDHLYAVNPDGTQQWAFAAQSAVYSSATIGLDGTIYVGSCDQNLYAINPDGTKKWAFHTGNWIYSTPAIAADGAIIVGSEDDNVYALNPDGTEKWVFTTGYYLTSSPAIGADGTTYIGSADYNIYAINPDGALLWSYYTNYSVTANPVIDSSGNLYVGSNDGNLYAFRYQGTPALTLTQSVSSALVAAGAPVSYTLSYQNIGDGAASNITITDTLPAGLSYTTGTATGNVSVAGQTLSWTVHSLAPGATGQVTFNAVTASAATGTVFANLAQIESTEVPAAVASNVSTVTITGSFQVTPQAGAGGSITPNSAQPVTYGHSVTFNALPNNGFTVANWTVNGDVLQVGDTQFTLTNVTAAATVQVSFKAALSAVTVTASPSSPSTVGTPISLTASATGGSDIQYQFWLYNPTATPAWTQLQGYSPSPVYNWTPTTAGSYLISVTAWEGDTGVAIAASPFWYSVTTPVLSSVSLQTSVATPQPVNTAITLTAQATGGTNVQYQVWVYCGSTVPNWQQLQTFSSSATCSWTPSTAGNYLLVVTARDGVTGQLVETTGWYIITNAPLTSLNISTTLTSPQPSSTSIALTAAAVGGADVQYKFWLYNAAASPTWTEVQGYSSSPVCNWTPTNTGDYLIVATAQDGITGTAVSNTLWFGIR